MFTVDKTTTTIIIIIIYYRNSRCVHKNYRFCHHKHDNDQPESEPDICGQTPAAFSRQVTPLDYFVNSNSDAISVDNQLLTSHELLRHWNYHAMMNVPAHLRVRDAWLSLFVTKLLWQHCDKPAVTSQTFPYRCKVNEQPCAKYKCRTLQQYWGQYIQREWLKRSR